MSTAHQPAAQAQLPANTHAHPPAHTEAHIPAEPAKMLIIGEALIDVVIAPDGTQAEHVGGSPANVAVGLARLGNHAELATWYGQDAWGAAIEAHLAADDVAITPGSNRATRTSSAQATLDETGAATYVFDLEWDVPPLQADTKAQIVHTGSIAATIAPGSKAVANLIESARSYATISYDPNVRPSIMESPQIAEPIIEHLVRHADVVKVSDEDLAWLYPGISWQEIARTWAGQGPAIVVVTAGGEGAYGITSAGIEVNVPAVATTVADTVGAGDSYMGGLLDGLTRAGLVGAAARPQLHQISPETLKNVMAWAAKIAGITVSRPGANPPSYQELTEHA